ncbi:MAG: RecQ family ATP-dependent DNA helicase [Thermogemmata sp.]
MQFPTEVKARARTLGAQCQFVQACGLPPAYVELLHDQDVPRSIIRAVAQWRLDYPDTRIANPKSDHENILAVAYSLLTRGTTPFCTPSFEHALGEAATSPQSAPVIEALRRVALVPSCRLTFSAFDSLEEQVAFNWIRDLLESHQLPWCILPQVDLGTLTRAIQPAGAQRGDFLLVHPHLPPVLIEVDGFQHTTHSERDRQRDMVLANAGVQTVRVPAAEVRKRSGRAVHEVERLLLKGKEEIPPENPHTRLIRWCKFAHQVQLALLTALETECLPWDGAWRVAVALPRMLQDDPEAERLLRCAVADLQELLWRLSRLYDRPPLPKGFTLMLVNEQAAKTAADVLIGPGDGSTDQLMLDVKGRFMVSDVYFPRDCLARCMGSSPVRLRAPRKEDAHWFLQCIFRKEEFWEGQWETVDRLLRGQDCIVLLPTGGGKSIAFQLAALLLPGRCIVVDPILALIDDQLDNLRRNGIDRCFGITSLLSTGEREQALEVFAAGHYLFCYVAPERFQIESFRQALRSLTTNMPVSVIVVDEAHCVSEWGHDFRTAYLNLGRIAREYCTKDAFVPPLAALTGTASRIVLKDVQRELGIESFEALITPKSFDRPELRFQVVTCRSREKIARLLGLLTGLPSQFRMSSSAFFETRGKSTCAGLIFCPHVNGPYGVVDVAEELRKHLRIRVAIYSGEAPRCDDRESWDDRKRRAAHDFKRDRVALLVCTKAFGMGIDKPNIRYTVHIGLPASIESFYQEAGRAGRDRCRAECIIILSNDDRNRAQRLLSPATPLEDIARVVQQRRGDSDDDVTRALWFHVRAFRGVKSDLEDISTLLDLLGDVSERREVTIGWQMVALAANGKDESSARERAEKALHRLVLLAVVEDYTVDFASGEFSVQISGASPDEIAAAFGRYARAYQLRLGEQAEAEARTLPRGTHRDYILAVAERLLHFIYQHVELARRRALSEMLQAASSAGSGEELRARILAYLGQSEWDDRLEKVRSSDRGGVDCLGPILDDLVSPNDAVALRAAAGRALASYPDVPGLLMLRAVAEALCAQSEAEAVRENMEAAISFGLSKYKLGPEELGAAIGQIVACGQRKPGAAELLLVASLRSTHADRIMIRHLLRYVPDPLAYIPAWLLLDQLLARCYVLHESKGE